MDIYKCPFLILKKKFVKMIFFVNFEELSYFNLIHILFVIIHVLFCPIFVHFCPIFLANFPEISGFSRIFPSFSKFFRIFPSFSYAVRQFITFLTETMCVNVLCTYLVKKNNGIFRIFLFQDSFLKMEFGHL